VDNIKRFIVYSNLFIAICAVAMVYQTYSFLLDTHADLNFLLFVFFATICSYSFHWYLPSHATQLSARGVWTANNKIILGLLFLLGLVGSIITFINLKTYWTWLVGAVFITFMYSAPKLPLVFFKELRKLAVGKTIFLALVWTYVTTWLPIIISPVPWKEDFYLFLLSRFFLIYAVCILFDYRDRADDKKAGIRSLITYLSERSITFLFFFSLVIFALTTSGLIFYDYDPLSIFLLLIPGILIALLYNYARKNFSDILYYLVLDGLMAFSAFLMLIPGI